LSPPPSTTEPVAEAIRKAEILLEALDFIRAFRHRVVVIKLGGSVLEVAETLDATLQDVVFTTVPSGRTVYHRVGKGDTLASIAARYDVTQQDLKSWNDGLTTKVVLGQKLRIVTDAGPIAGARPVRKKTGSTSASGRTSKPAPPTPRPRVAAGQHP